MAKKSIINLNYFVESDEYSQYTFPALRALEGHIKYLIISAGGNVNHNFNTFNKDANGTYIFTGNISDLLKKPQIEKCYNFYKAQRDTIFHYGDIFGNTDSRRLLETKDAANEIIQNCISLICEM